VLQLTAPYVRKVLSRGSFQFSSKRTGEVPWQASSRSARTTQASFGSTSRQPTARSSPLARVMRPKRVPRRGLVGQDECSRREDRRSDRTGTRAQLICREVCQEGRVRRRRGATPTAPRCFLGESVWCACRLATRGQTDMRGLVTAGRGFGWIASACLASSVN
jgi:hypothetical protein